MRQRADSKIIREDNPFLLSVGDVMAALLLIFVLLLSATLLRLEEEYSNRTDQAKAAQQLAEQRELLAEEARRAAEKIQQIATAYRKSQDDLYYSLYREFKDDLKAWSAVLNRETLSIRFQEPEVLFDAGQIQLKERFKVILNDFFPRYIRILTRPEYRDNIEEIRIEGHTSSEWQNADGDTAYIRNMELSQGRTRSVLEYVLSLITEPDLREWARSKITANGLSSSRLVIINGVEDKEASRRVEFRVRTDAEKRIGEILGMNR